MVFSNDIWNQTGAEIEAHVHEGCLILLPCRTVGWLIIAVYEPPELADEIFASTARRNNRPLILFFSQDQKSRPVCLSLVGSNHPECMRPRSLATSRSVGTWDLSTSGRHLK